MKYARASRLSFAQWGLLVFSALSLIAYAGLLGLHLQFGTLRAGITPLTIRWYLLAFVVYLVAVIWVERWPVSLRWIWAGAFLFRLPLLFTSPTLSDDIYRYQWDGHVAVHGISPYAYAINAPELDELAIPERDKANNPEMASPYLPAAQWIFAGLVALFPLQPIFLQILFTIFDLLSGWLITRLLVRAALPAHRVILYIWNPLVILETVHSAHIDAWMIVLVLAAVWFTVEGEQTGGNAFRMGKRMAAPISLALATLTKLLPVLLLPVLAWRWSWRQRLVYAGFSVGLILPAVSRAGWGLTGPLSGTGVFGALRIYADRWEFNSGLFAWLELWLIDLGLTKPVTTAKWIALVLLSIICLITWVITREQRELRWTLRLAAIPFMAYLLLTPTVHPWYALIVLVFLPFMAPQRDEPRSLWLAVIPWLYLSGTLIFSYLTYLDPFNHQELIWVRWLEWGPTLAMLLVLLLVDRYRSLVRPDRKF